VSSANDRGRFRSDLEKYYIIFFNTTTPTLEQKLKLWLTHYGLHCVAIYRFSQLTDRALKRHGKLALPLKCVRLGLNTFMGFFHHVDITCDIGAGLFIGHASNIYIGAEKIGENFSVTHNVTIGYGHTRSGSKGVPTIGNDVWIGTGSVISGEITLGDQVTLAHGSMLSRSVPSKCLIGGNPAKLILKDYDNNDLLRWRRPQAA